MTLYQGIGGIVALLTFAKAILALPTESAA
jgi:hypothetical protein